MIRATVEGTLARINHPTVDGRVLELTEPGLAHFVRLPVPIVAQSADPIRSDVVGSISMVRLQKEVVTGRSGIDLFGIGDLDLDLLREVRPDLVPPTTEHQAGDPTPFLPVEIMITGQEFRKEGQLLILHGSWELASVTIPREPGEVWAGTHIGLRYTTYELSQS